MKAGEIRALTGLRGVAALVVMAYHFQVVPARPGVDVRAALASAGPGYLMVDLFFILSGFVMARTYGRLFCAGFGWVQYRSFLQARFARVYPLYGLVTVAVFALTKLHVMRSASFPVRAMLSNIVLVENLGAGWLAPGFAEYLVPPSWSISTELGAYLLFPVLAGWALFGSWRVCGGVVIGAWLAMVGLVCLPVAWLDQFSTPGTLNISSGETLWPLLRCLAGFSMGLVVCRIAALHRVAGMRRHGGIDLLLVCLLAGLWWWRGNDLLLVALFPVLILQLCTDGSPLAWALGSVVPHRLGEWSYAIYLLHWSALGAMPWLYHLLSGHFAYAWSAGLAVIAAGVIGVSALAHVWVERPARAALRLVFHRRPMPIDMEPGVP